MVHDRVAHCFDGALFAAAMLRRIGHDPLIVDLLPNKRDDDHILALYEVGGHWGAVAKSNFSGLRYREPIFKTLRELVLSYFEHFYNVKGEKTLRAYLTPLNLKAFDRYRWMTDNDSLIRIEKRLFAMRPIPLLNKSVIARLARVDNRSYRAGMLDTDAAGLYRP